MLFKMIEKLKKVVREDQILSSHDDLVLFNYDSSLLEGNSAFVVRPENSYEIQNIVALAKRYDFSITIRGSGTSLTGASTPENNVVLDMSYFNKIKVVNTKEMWIDVEPYVTVDQINNVLSSRGLFFPVIPSTQSVASIGGMVATNAGGSYSYKYGRMNKFVEGLEYIDGSGKIFYLNENNSFKDLIGSEGCCGIITKIRLKLVEVIKQSAMFYDTFLSAREMIKKMESLENDSYSDNILGIEFISKFTSDDNRYHLFVEYDLTTLNLEHKQEDIEKNKINELKNKFKKILGFELTQSKSIYPWNYDDVVQIKKLKKIRDDVGFKFSSKKFIIVADPFIPRRHAYDFIKFCETNNIVLFGHLGRGVYHLMFREDQKDKLEKMYGFVFEVSGKISGEQGIGFEKRNYLSEEDKFNFGKIKYKHDYNNILNRNKYITTVYFENFKNKFDVEREKNLIKDKQNNIEELKSLSKNAKN